MITVQVKKNQIVASKPKLEPMTSGSQNVYPIQFLFSSEWAYLEKIAVFTTEMSKDGPGSSVYNVLIDDNDRCFIPWEVTLSNNNHVYVGVYGTMNGNVILPTGWCDLGSIALGVTTGLDSEPPTPDIHDQILAKIAELKSNVSKYTTDTTNLVNRTTTDLNNTITTYQNTVTASVNKHQSDVTASINKHQADVAASISKFQTDTTNLINKYQNDTSALFNTTADRIRDEALGKIASIRKVVDDFTSKGLQIISGATIVNKDGFPDKLVPTDTNENAVVDSNLPIPKFPRAYILTNTTIASNAEENSRSWAFLNEPVYVREGLYMDENENVIDAIYVTDMTGTTYAFLTDDSGNFNDMVEVIGKPVQYEDIVGTPDISDVTRLKSIAITLRADKWVEVPNEDQETESGVGEQSEDGKLPNPIMQTIRMWGISPTQRDQLVIPIPRDDVADDYYKSDVVLIGQDLNALHFRVNGEVPTKDLVVYIYVFNATSYQWVEPPEPTTPGNGDGCCTCTDYEFDGGLIEEVSEEKGTVVVRVNTVDDFETNPDLPISAKGVKNIVGDIERLLSKL